MMRSTYLLLIAILAIVELAVGSSSKCDRTPEGSSASKSPPDGRYRLRIFNDPVRYLPGEIYNISLEGITRFAQTTPHKFTGFFITVERDFSDVRHTGVRALDDSVGRFQLETSATSKFSEKCQNLVTHTSSFPKNEILVSWTAPPHGSGCVVFKSTVIEHRDVWYSDDGALSKILCEDEADSGNTQPIILEECTACDEAKYELTFEGLWSRHTHPKDFPDNGWLTKFSDVIGASHTTAFRFWTYGKQASDGLKELAEHGSTRQLEKELKDEGEHIRTIIKARGISYPNVTGKTFAVFRVDSNHHLVSLVSMIYPSPDWFVGVSGLELCLSNGSWVDEKILNLYPYDAGTDSGPTYISSDQPTIPQEAIRRIKPNQPNDPRSPFHDPDNQDMKPLARLYLTRQRLYEKNCETQEQNPSQESGNDCSVTGWSEWSECDTPCGKGKITRTREFRNAAAAYGCRQKLQDNRECQGTEEICNGEFDQTTDEGESQQGFHSGCELTDWTESECSKPCGKGEKTRTRQYVDQSRRKGCQKKLAVTLEETVECEGQNCAGPIASDRPAKKTHKNCPLSKWSQYTSCSGKCGPGERIRVRIPTNRQKLERNLEAIMTLHNKIERESKGRRYNSRDDGDDDEDNSDLDVDEISDPDHPCYKIELIQRQPCENPEPCDNDINGRPHFCELKPTIKKCDQPNEVRWFYKKNTQQCGIFTYTGCRGNSNNFESEELCRQTCARPINEPLRSYSLMSHGDDLSEKVDCKVTHWKHEPCNATCGEGYRWKFRSIIQHPQNGGLPCPRMMVHFEHCYKDCGSSRVAPSSGNPINPHHHQCRYSNWSAWSPCSKTCGDSAVQIRTRTVQNHLSTHLCNERLEERRCEVMPCLVRSGYNYNYRS